MDTNSTISRSFACTTIVIASYCFPSLRIPLLEKMSDLLPSRFHMNPKDVDTLHFKTSSHSVCNAFEDCDESQLFSNTIYSEVEIEEPIPPPLVIKPFSETMVVDDEGMDETSILQRIQSKHHVFSRRSSFDVVENENPFSTTTSLSMLRYQMLCQDETMIEQDVHYPFMCIIPFMKFSKAVRSKKLEAQYSLFVKQFPDFYRWEEVSKLVSVDSIDLSWVEK